jgi:nitrogen fixation-related uncharacterized protein
MPPTSPDDLIADKEGDTECHAVSLQGRKTEMYYPYFIAYMLSGFVISLIVLFWALRHKQFRDQSRLRFLPLADEPHPGSAAKVTRMNRWEGIVLLGLACAGLATTAAILFFTLYRW